MGMKAPVTKKGEGASFELPPPGTYYAACNGVYMLGTQPNSFGKPRTQLLATFELHKRKGPAKDSSGRVFDASLTINHTANIKSTLIELAGAMRGESYADDELEDIKAQGGFDPETLLDGVCKLEIERGKKMNGDPKTVIKTISKLDPEDDDGIEARVKANRETDSVYWDWTLGTEAPRRIKFWWDQAEENPNRRAFSEPIAAVAAAPAFDTTDETSDAPF